MPDSLQPVREAIKAGDKRRARELLRPLLVDNPTADMWFLAAQASPTREQAMGCLKRALALDPAHERAGRALSRLAASAPADDTPPPLVAPVDNAPLAASEAALPPLKKVRSQRKRSPWTLVGLAGSLLLSLSLTYAVLTALGSPIAAQVRAILGGEAPQAGDGTPVFGQPRQPASGAPVIGQPSGGGGGDTGASPSGSFVVRPNKSVELKRQQPVSDVLDAGFAHEYTFEAARGEEIAVGVQFLSPTAQKVGANVAIIGPDGYNAESRCQRDQILTDGSSVAFICTVHQGGVWKLQLFGRDGESTGVYVVTYERM
ncbi:MAG: hypothetical protein DWB42_12440 [Chloroflexi bacterium]|nr:hypothetical protein [Chloroflexota bacterium]